MFGYLNFRACPDQTAYTKNVRNKFAMLQPLVVPLGKMRARAFDWYMYVGHNDAIFQSKKYPLVANSSNVKFINYLINYYSKDFEL